jgi:hypothetical protein
MQLMDALSPADVVGLRLIVEHAQREGWISPDAVLAAEYEGANVRVTATRGKNVVRKTYPRDERWSYRLLRDLAWGTYSSGFDASTADRAAVENRS